MKAKTFTPNELRNISQKLESMRELSSGYFKVACELRDKACSERECVVPHCYVFPAVIMYVSSLEAYFIENLTLSSFRMDDEALKEEVDKIKAGSGDYKTFGNRVKEIFKLYDKNNKGIDTNGFEYQNLIALVELRNSVVHYNPLFIEHVKWPSKLEKVLQRSKIDVMNSGWVSNLSTCAIAKWAYETSKSLIILFCNLSGGINPFNCSDEYETFRWE